MRIKSLNRVENIVAKGEIAHRLLQMCQNASTKGITENSLQTNKSTIYDLFITGMETRL